MREHIIAYGYSDGFLEDLSNFSGNVINEWSSNEAIALRKDDLTWDRDDDFSDYIQDKLRNNEELVVNLGSFEETDTRYRFDELCNHSDELTGVIEAESPGGDIRKYTTTVYGGFDLSIDFKLFRSKDPHITGFEPISMSSVETMMSMDFCEDRILDDSRYPTGRRMLVWSDIMAKRFDIECEAMGTIHWGENADTEAGFDGFVIRDATDEVDEFIRNTWFEDSNGLFMEPHEYDMYKSDNMEILDSSVIRMWWD